MSINKSNADNLFQKWKVISWLIKDIKTATPVPKTEFAEKITKDALWFPWNNLPGGDSTAGHSKLSTLDFQVMLISLYHI